MSDNKDSCWKEFLKSGKVSDYLRYAAAARQTSDTAAENKAEG